MKQFDWVIRRIGQGTMNTAECVMESAADPAIKGAITHPQDIIYRARKKGYDIGDNKTGRCSNYFLISAPSKPAQGELGV